MNDYFEITRRGERENGEAYEDTFSLSVEQTELLKRVVRDEIRRIEEKVAWRVRSYLKERREALVELICTIDT